MAFLQQLIYISVSRPFIMIALVYVCARIRFLFCILAAG